MFGIVGRALQRQGLQMETFFLYLIFFVSVDISNNVGKKIRVGRYRSKITGIAKQSGLVNTLFQVAVW